MRWFVHCYDIEFTPQGAAVWRRVALPAAGGVGDQDAWLMDGLEYVAGLHQQLVEDMEKRRRREAVKKQQEMKKGNGR